MPKYDSSFFEYVNSGSLASAERLLPVLLDSLPITSVLDVGCGQGAWLSIWNKLGVEDVCGIDASYVDRSKLLVSDSLFQPLDLTTRFHMKRRYDLAQSLEVAEHLPKAIAPQFVDCLCAHSDLVLFSAAPPGQGVTITSTNSRMSIGASSLCGIIMFLSIIFGPSSPASCG